MANAFLVSKWKQWFHVLDVTKDGMLCDRDAAAMREKFSKLHHLHDKEKATLCEDITKWWKEFIFQGRTGNITEKAFVDLLSKEYEDQAKFRDMALRMCDVFFRTVDVDHNDMMTEEDFVICWKAFGHANEAHLKEGFKDYKPVDGRIPMKKVKDEWFIYVTSSDPKKGSVVSHGIALGVDI